MLPSDRDTHDGSPPGPAGSRKKNFHDVFIEADTRGGTQAVLRYFFTMGTRTDMRRIFVARAGSRRYFLHDVFIQVDTCDGTQVSSRCFFTMGHTPTCEEFWWLMLFFFHDGDTRDGRQGGLTLIFFHGT
jgi:hypothetical protein